MTQNDVMKARQLYEPFADSHQAGLEDYSDPKENPVSTPIEDSGLLDKNS